MFSYECTNIALFLQKWLLLSFELRYIMKENMRLSPRPVS